MTWYDFVIIQWLLEKSGSISEDTIKNAFCTVRSVYEIKPLLANVGLCCLVGIISKVTLYVANLGDSRGVIGYLGKSNKILAEQLIEDHNANMEEVRQELWTLHHEDSHIVDMKHGVWLIKGIIQFFLRLVLKYRLFYM